MINKLLIPELNSDEPPRLEIRHRSFAARRETAISATFPASGGLIFYGPDGIDQYRRAAGYVDRVLKGEKPADLPVQAPTKYELVVNLKTAKLFCLSVPPPLLASDVEVIE